MRTNTVRAFIAIAMVLVFIGLTVVLALFPLFSSRNVEITQYADFFVKIASVYTGIIGVIVGYYFARATQTKETSAQPTDSATPQAVSRHGA